MNVFPRLDTAEITAGLSIGSFPPRFSPLADFDILVLCAKEYQPPSSELPGAHVIHAGIDDGVGATTSEDMVRALWAADHVAAAVQARRRVLVTCIQGRNRSGLVCGLALVRLGVEPEAAIRMIRAVRPTALGRDEFVGFILGAARSAA